jgi:hypothetical protein
MNTMKITGSFSYAEIHSWIQFCLADVPERPPIDKENRLIYTNIFLQTQLECIYRYYSDYFHYQDKIKMSFVVFFQTRRSNFSIRKCLNYINT